MKKLNTSGVTDRFTGLVGSLTHLLVYSNGNEIYLFQPKAINPKTGHPVDKLWITEDRIKGATNIEEPENLREARPVLGTIVTDKASGVKGVVNALTLHTTGCVHVEIQPRGTIKETGDPIRPVDVDIRRCSGSKVPKFEEQKVEERKRPSPAGDTPTPHENTNR